MIEHSMPAIEASTWILETSHFDLVENRFNFRRDACLALRDRAREVAFGGADGMVMPADLIETLGRLREQVRFNFLLVTRMAERRKGTWPEAGREESVERLLSDLSECVSEVDAHHLFASTLKEQCKAFEVLAALPNSWTTAGR